MPDHSRSPSFFLCGTIAIKKGPERTPIKIGFRFGSYWCGAGNETWTRDIYLGKVTLYHWAIPAYSAYIILCLHNISYLFHKCKRFYARFYNFFDFFRKIALIPLTNRWHTGYNNKNLVTQGENYVLFECMVAWIIRRSHKRYVLRMLLSRRKAYRKNDTSIIQDPTVCFV